MKKIFHLHVITFFVVFSSLLIADDYWNTFQYPQEAKNYIYSAKLNGDRLFLGTNGHGLFYTDDGGANWTKFDYDNFSYVGIYDILFGPAGEIYCITRNQIYKTSDAGKNWDYINYFSDNDELIKSASINPQGTIVVGTDKGVYISDSSLGGTQWTKIETNHKDFISDKVVIDPFNNIIVGGWGDGVYRILWADIISDTFTEAVEGIGCNIDSVDFTIDNVGNILASVKRCILQFDAGKRNWTELGQTEDDNAKRIRAGANGILVLFNAGDIILYEPKTRKEVKNPGINDTSKKNIVDILVLTTGEVIVVDQEEVSTSSVTSIVLIFDFTPQKFRVFDIRGNSLNNSRFQLHKGTCDNNLTYIREVRTNNQGYFELPLITAGISYGDKIKLLRLLDEEDSWKPERQIFNGKVYDVMLDNMKFDGLGVPTYQEITTDTLQNIIMDHSLIGLNLIISVEWDAKREVLDSIAKAMKIASMDLYDITDGQLYIKKVAIYDNKRNWRHADIIIHASTEQWPRATVLGWLNMGISYAESHIYMPRKFWGNGTDDRNNGHSWNWNTIPYWTTTAETIAHEIGHYFLAFWDEYEWTDTVRKKMFPGINFGFMMDNYLWRDTLGRVNFMGSEMSTPQTYTNPNARYTVQWARNHTDCWSQFRNSFQGEFYVDPPTTAIAKIYLPSERALAPGYSYLLGPVDIITNQAGCNPMDYMNVQVFDSSTGAGNVNLRVQQVGLPTGYNIFCSLRRDPSILVFEWPLDQGVCSNLGTVCVLGARVNDIVDLWGNCGAYWGGWRSGTYRVTSVSGAEKSSDETQEEVFDVELLPIEGDYRFLNLLKYNSNGTLDLNIITNRKMPLSPFVNIYSEQGESNIEFLFDEKETSYYANLSDQFTGSDLMTYTLFDDNSMEYRVPEYLITSDATDNIASTTGKTEIYLDTLNQFLGRIAVLSSPLPALLNGLPDSTEQVGETVSITTYPNELSSQDNNLKMWYQGDTLYFHNETSLSIFMWDLIGKKWIIIPSYVDTDRKYVSANFSESGTYAIFTTESETGINDIEFFDTYGLKAEPNPATGKTLISFNMPNHANASLELYNMLGVKIKTISSGRLSAGRNEQELDFSGMTDGCYFIKLTSNGRSEITSVIVVK